MVYIRSDGSMEDQRSPWRLSIVSDFLYGVIDICRIFFESISQRPDQLRNGNRRTTYTERQGIRRPTPGSSGGGSGGSGSSGGARRSNIRGVKDLGAACAPGGGGG
eukprot:CAMPEP_0197823528 /NCGR_PEP_ID=MMETSP1437-20131217/872_1 /TAXON_ID=49252 ORGANISM="Eucampia antarctica, Strain CCMP1452" /NCGR_SAMPLE_ID=MMETSP1437 /ASSEMBLY_ACC=CAM_ASM_001096 /LENGTH=105 /DNA_ID=CAMNT_0043422749 /DNA_START=38 /DNA_END=355 /DNA_ORIENTATION=-